MVCTGDLRPDEFTETPTQQDDLLELHPFQAKTYSPFRKASVVAAVLAAVQEAQSVRTVGSLYSLSEAHAAENIIHTLFLNRHLSQPYPPSRGTLPPARLRDTADPALLAKICRVPADQLTGRHFIFVEAGVQIRQLLTDLKKCGLALPTMGAGGGQTLIGAISTATHGADFTIAPLSDWIHAVLLVGPGGQEWWIADESGPFSGDGISQNMPEWCAETIIVNESDWLDAVRVSVGRMGAIYGVILEVVPDYALLEINLEHAWPAIRESLGRSSAGPMHRTGVFDTDFTDLDGGRFQQTFDYVKRQAQAQLARLHFPFPVSLEQLYPHLATLESWRTHLGLARIADRLRGSGPKPLRHLNVVVNLANPDQCWTTERWAVPVGTGQANLSNPAPTGVVKAIIDHPRTPERILPVLWDSITEGVSDFELAIGYALDVTRAQRLKDEFADEMKRIAAASATSGEALILIMYRLVTDPILGLGATEPVLRRVSEAMSSDFKKPVRLGHACDMLDVHNYDLDGAQSGNSAEFMFDATGANYLQFIDRVLKLAKDRLLETGPIYMPALGFITGPAPRPVFGYMGIRFTPKASALVATQRFPLTVSVEVTTARARQEDIYAYFWAGVHQLAAELGGIPHWGQEFRMDDSAIARLHGADLVRWRQIMTELAKGRVDPFSTTFSRSVGLEPVPADRLRWLEHLRQLAEQLPGLDGIRVARQAVAIGYELAGHDPEADNPFQGALATAILMLANRVYSARPGDDAAVEEAQHAIRILRHLATTAAQPQDKARWLELLRQLAELLPGPTGINAARQAVAIGYQLAGHDPEANNPYQGTLATAILMLANRIYSAHPGDDAAVEEAQHAIRVFTHLATTAETPQDKARWLELLRQLAELVPGPTGINAARQAIAIGYELAGHDPEANNPYQGTLATAILTLANRVYSAHPGDDAAVEEAQHAIRILTHLATTAAQPQDKARWLELLRQLIELLPGPTDINATRPSP